MKTEDFNKIVEHQTERCKFMLCKKAAEYARKEFSEDRLAAFKKAAAYLNTTPENALLGALTKHLVSISDMVISALEYPVELWEEKITDTMNYLMLLEGLIYEKNSGCDPQ